MCSAAAGGGKRGAIEVAWRGDGESDIFWVHLIGDAPHGGKRNRASQELVC